MIQSGKLVFSVGGVAVPPVNLLIKPASSMCNMRCKYCFYVDVSLHRERVSYGMMDEGTLEVLVKRVFAYATGYAGFAFQGGEPTLVGLEFYRKLIALQKQYNIQKIRVYNSIQTNGYTLDEEWAAFFADHHFLVGLSMDGTKEAHDALRQDAQGSGTYEAVAKSAALLERFGVQFNILCVVNHFVARHPQKVYQNLKKYRYLQFIPCLDGFEGEKENFSLSSRRYGEFLKATFDLYYRDFLSGNYISVRNFDNYIRMLQGYPPESCGMSGICSCQFVVEGDGSVFPCDFYVLDRWKLGNIREHSLQQMLETEPMSAFVETSRQRASVCESCPYFRLCRGGCRREREPIAEGSPEMNRFCESYRMFFDYAGARMMQMARMTRTGGK